MIKYVVWRLLRKPVFRDANGVAWYYNYPYWEAQMCTHKDGMTIAQAVYQLDFDEEQMAASTRGWK